METVGDPYEDVALVYTGRVRRESQDAAIVIEQIHDAFGSHAALRAALIITILKMDVQQNHWMPYYGLYAHLLEDCPDAGQLTMYAAVCCLQNWGVSGIEIETSGWAELPIAPVRTLVH